MLKIDILKALYMGKIYIYIYNKVVKVIIMRTRILERDVLKVKVNKERITFFSSKTENVVLLLRKYNGKHYWLFFIFFKISFYIYLYIHI